MTPAFINAPAWTQATPPLPPNTRAAYRTSNNASCFPPHHPLLGTLFLHLLHSLLIKYPSALHISHPSFHMTPVPDQIPRFIPSHHTMYFSFIGTYQFVIVHLLVQLVSELLNITGRTVSGFCST